ncbi:response regulator [Roseibium sp. LAB1]
MSANILVVEDEWLIASDIASTLRGANLHVVGPCASVKDACFHIRQEALTAAILDIELNGETSLPVAEKLHEKNIPFLFLSGHNIDKLPPKLRQYQLVSKPVEQTTLLTLVRELCS